jgi:hypothetical protein
MVHRKNETSSIKTRLGRQRRQRKIEANKSLGANGKSELVRNLEAATESQRAREQQQEETE